MLDHVALHGLTDPLDTEVWFGDRVAILGPNGAGKSHFIRLLNGDSSVRHDGEVRLGAGVVPGYFNQTHDRPELHGRTLLDTLERRDQPIGPAMSRAETLRTARLREADV